MQVKATKGPTIMSNRGVMGFKNRKEVVIAKKRKAGGGS